MRGKVLPDAGIRMKRRQEPQLVAVWCLVLAILVAGLAVALVSIT